MAVTKIGQNLWQIRISVRVPGKDDPAKKQEQFSGTKIEAQLRESELIQAAKTLHTSSRSLKLEQKSIKNFQDVLNVHVEKLEAEGTLSKPHKRKIDFIEKELGHILLSDFADRFESFIRALKGTKTTHGTIRSAASTNRIVSLVRAVYNTGIDLKILSENPVTKDRFPKGKEKARDRYLSIEERNKLLITIREYRPYILPFIEYNLAVPCRKSELVLAKKEQYNPFTNTIYIPDSKGDIPINKPVPPSMKEYFRNIPADCPYLFYRQDSTGKYHSLGDFRKAWAYCLKKAGIEDVRIHDLRHISATELYSNGIPEREIMDIAGWKTPMLSTYRHKNSLKTAQKINCFFEQSANSLQIHQNSASV